MTEKRSDDQENVEALELLSDGAPPLPKRTGEGRRAAARKGAAGPPAAPPIPAMPSSVPQNAGPEDDVPLYRCLHCGYPLTPAAEPRCAECGRLHDPDTLRLWFLGDERQRLSQVNWFVLATLFGRLLLLPDLLWVGRTVGALVVIGASYLIWRARQDTVGAYYAIAGMVVGGLMLVAFTWAGKSLPFYTLDMIAACLLLMGTLHDTAGRKVCGTSIGWRLVPVLLFAAPVFAVCCYVLELVFGGQLGVGTLLERYSPFSFILPYLGAAAVWLFVWYALTAAYRTLFAAPAD